jgi:hypothetical protein
VYEGLEKYLRKESKSKKNEDQVQKVLYYVRPSNPEGQLDAIEQSLESDRSVVENNPELQVLLDESLDVFRNSLPEGLWRDVDHVIDTHNEAPSNRNAYELSVV